MNMEIQKIIDLELEILKSQKENLRKQADAQTYQNEYLWALSQARDNSAFDKALLFEYKKKHFDAVLDSKRLIKKIELLETERNSLEKMALDGDIIEYNSTSHA